MGKVFFENHGWAHYVYRQDYEVHGEETVVLSCMGHYDDK